MFTSNNQQITVDRKELLKVLKTNRTKHATEFGSLLAAWKEALKAETAALAERTAAGNFEDIKIESRRPTHSLDSYDDTIEMLEMSVDEKIILDHASFKSYVKDEWGWKSQLQAVHASNTTVMAKYIR
jgi:hypothetical protein